MRYSAAIIAVAALTLTGCAPEATAPEATALVNRPSLLQSSGSAGTAVYNNIPNPTPGNVPSQGFQCCGTAEVGDYVALAGTARNALSATVLMSSWSRHSDYPDMDAAGYKHPITLNIYNVDNSAPTPALGSLIKSVTREMLIPWRPEPSSECGTAWWSTSDSQCYNGYAFTIEFDLRDLALTLPDKFIFGVAYNTNTWGYAPIGQPGPYESLNVGTANVGGVGVPPSVGTDVEPDAVFWNTAHSWYTDGGVGGTFRRDYGWLGYSPAVRFDVYTVAACKNGGWQTLSSAARPFRNQGDCVSFVSSGK